MIPYEDYFTSCMGTLITSTTFTSFISQATGNTRYWVQSLDLVNAHATADTIINIISGGKVVRSYEVAPKTTLPIDYGEVGIPLSLNAGMELQCLNVASCLVNARGYKKTNTL